MIDACDNSFVCGSAIPFAIASDHSSFSFKAETLLSDVQITAHNAITNALPSLCYLSHECARLTNICGTVLSTITASLGDTIVDKYTSMHHT